MCAAGELGLDVYLCVLVVGIVLIKKGRKGRILFIETNNLLDILDYVYCSYVSILVFGYKRGAYKHPSKQGQVWPSFFNNL